MSLFVVNLWRTRLFPHLVIDVKLNHCGVFYGRDMPALSFQYGNNSVFLQKKQGKTEC